MPDKAPASLDKFQREYATYLRSPHHTPRPQDIPHAPSAVYESLLINNVRGFLNACFPVIRSVIPEQKWQRLTRVFFRDWSARSPLFSEVAKEFVAYLQSDQAPQFIPAWLAELAHYEWVELMVDTHPGTVPSVTAEYSNQMPLRTNPTVQILNYQWPVQTISPTNKKPRSQPTHLLVYRASNHKVQFMETNAITNAMLELIQQSPGTLDVTMQALARLIPNSNAQQLKTFAEPLAAQLIAQQVLLGSG